jgi:cell division protease FtsH
MPRDRFHSEQTAREIDEEIRHIITQSQGKVREILEARRPALVALAEQLIERESIDTDELKEIVEANSPGPTIVPGTSDVPKRKPASGAAQPKGDAVEGG